MCLEIILEFVKLGVLNEDKSDMTENESNRLFCCNRKAQQTGVFTLDSSTFCKIRQSNTRNSQQLFLVKKF